jgi:hypothetical protein
MYNSFGFRPEPQYKKFISLSITEEKVFHSSLAVEINSSRLSGSMTNRQMNALELVTTPIFVSYPHATKQQADGFS